jgi:hypothetical protein
MEKTSPPCHFVSEDVREFTTYIGFSDLSMLGMRSALNRSVSYLLVKFSILPPLFRFVTRTKNQVLAGQESTVADPSRRIDPEPLELRQGEWVQVRDLHEIHTTLDRDGRYRGLSFMPEMMQFCGKKFKVYRRVEAIRLETTGEMRRMKSPTVFLEGVFCDGSFHGGCHRSCFCFWKEAWLKRISSPAGPEGPSQ